MNLPVGQETIFTEALLRYFVEMTVEEAAEALGISVPTATRYWAYARAWPLDGNEDTVRW